MSFFAGLLGCHFINATRGPGGALIKFMQLQWSLEDSHPVTSSQMLF